MSQLDIDKAIAESGLPQSILDDILREAREDYPDDEMLYELRVIRSIDGERYQRLGPEAWKEQIQQKNQDFLERHGYDLVDEPIEVVQRIRRKPQAS